LKIVSAQRVSFDPNQCLACIRSFFTYAAAAEPELAMSLADPAATPGSTARPRHR
jgi:hypothetical protein